MPTSSLDSQFAIELLRKGESVELVVGGGSMWPLVKHGDRLLITPVDPSGNFRRGTLLAVLSEGHVVVHRVVGVDAGSGRLVLQGDNLPAPDPPVLSSQVLGQVSQQVLKSGLVLKHQRQPLLVLNRALVPALKVSRPVHRHIFEWRRRRARSSV